MRFPKQVASSGWLRLPPVASSGSCSCVWLGCGLLTLYLLIGQKVTAQVLQVTEDNTLPMPTVVTNMGGQFEITGGTVAGTNLFHSFTTFSVPDGGRATFQPFSPNIQNIFGRITGTSPSVINGTIESQSNATLFLLNPNGILFGPNAQLDLQGSFVGSTAEGIQFADGQNFSINTPQPTTLLTVSTPVGLQFGDNPGSIVNRSTNDAMRNVFDMPGIFDSPGGLTVQPGNTLALVGGSIDFISGRATAQGGRIELGSVGRNSIVDLSPNPQGWSFAYDTVVAFNDIELRRVTPNATLGTEIDASNGGTVNVHGRHISLSEGSQIISFTLENSDASGGELNFVASGTLEVVGLGSLVASQVGFMPNSLASSDGGNVSISTERLLIENGGSISSGTNGIGNAGNLSITASLIQLLGVGQSTINIGGMNLDIIIPSSLVIGTEGTGDGGVLSIDTEQLVIQDGGQLSANTGGAGTSATLSINATDSILVTGISALDNRPSLITIASTGIDNTGNSSSLSLSTNTLSVQNGAVITVVSEGQGMAGDLTIIADRLFLDDGQLTAETLFSNGGNINLQISDLLQLRNGSQITAEAGTLLPAEGDIEVGVGNGGNITLNTGILFAFPDQNNDIIANSSGGQGGTIAINAQGVFGIFPRSAVPADNGTNDIDASSGIGLDGQIQINTLVSDPNSGLVKLPETVSDPSQKIATSCTAQQGSRFVQSGRGGLPANPTKSLSNQPIWHDLRDPTDFRIGSSESAKIKQHLAKSPIIVQSPTTIIEATGWHRDDRGQIKLTHQRPNLESIQAQNSPAHCSPS